MHRTKRVLEDTKLKVIQEGAVGQSGFMGGPYTHVIDYNALGDPLLARLPRYMTPEWRIGHLQRDLPIGYAASIMTNTNRIADSSLARYYDKLCVLTNGPISSITRFIEIVRFNLGAYDGLKEAFLSAPAVHVNLRDVAWRDDFRLEIADSILVPFGTSGIVIDLDSIFHASSVSFLSEAPHPYLAVLFLRGNEVLRDTIEQSPFAKWDDLAETSLIVPVNVQEEGFDQIDVSPLYKNASTRIGMLRLFTGSIH